ncbi:MAG: amidase [bacterium]|nr:amidase [bacterium]MDE0353285.1 amidase [bacterium]
MRPRAIARIARQLREGATTSVEITGRTLDAIDQINDRLNAFVLVDREGAMRAAEQADRVLNSGKGAGPLTGVPVAIKDIIHMRGLPTRCGSPAYPDTPRDHDAAVVGRLREAGAVMVGKTTTHELACGVSSPPATNPWDTARLPGGSSGGSGAAVAAGVVPMALGSDTGGSIRIPASVCGIAGLKPTFGRVSRAGVETLAWSLDHIGPLAATVEDCATTLQILAGHDPADPPTEPTPPPDYSAELGRGVDGLRLGIMATPPFTPMQEDVERAFRDAVEHLEGLGADVVPVDVPELVFTLDTEFSIVGPEAAAYHRRLLRESPELISPDIRELFTIGTILPSTHYLRGLGARRVIREALRRAFARDRLDAAITPTLPATAALADQEMIDYGEMEEGVITSYVRTTAPFNLSGQPALTVPCGFDRDGLPIGLQIAGRPFDEVMVLRIGAAYEATTTWSDHRPPVRVDG